MKRAFDLLLVVVSSPLWVLVLAATALAVRVRMGRPVLFIQERAGLGGRPFRLVKFRTMREGEGSDAERLTGFGRILRATSLDELPELWNVLKGEMSLVGPRPLPVRYLPRYTPEQNRRHAVLPGITGWAQVNGRNALDWEEKFRYDLEYVDRHTFWMDVRILVKTVAQVILSRNISHEGEATMSEFTGSIKRGGVLCLAGLLMGLLVGCQMPGENPRGVFPCVWSDRGSAVFPLYYRGPDGVATLPYGNLEGSKWIVPLFWRTDVWSVNLLYATKDDVKTGEHGLLLPWLLTWSSWNDNGGSSLYTPVCGWIGGGTSQTNAWWATPLVGTHSGRREGWWLFPLYEEWKDPQFEDKVRTLDAEFLPADVSFPMVEVVDFLGAVSTNCVLRGSVRTEDESTCLALFDNDRTVTDRFTANGGTYRYVCRRKVGNRLILGCERTIDLVYEIATRQRLSRRESSCFSLLWRMFRYADDSEGGTEVDFLFLPVWR